MSLKIESLYGIATLQGAPLNGFRRFGVPPGGAFDVGAMALANGLVGNEPAATVLELGMAAAEFRADSEINLALSGAECVAVAADRVILPQTTFSLSAGEVLRVAAPSRGARVYLAVPGGWNPGLAGLARAAFPRARTGDVLRANEASPNGEAFHDNLARNSLQESPLRIVRGPQYSDSLEEAISRPEFRVSHLADRVGVRLIGPPLPVQPEIPSEPACPGTIQVANDGQLIVLGPDGPTIGGYAKPAVVCSADLDRLAQLRPDDTVRFKWIPLDTGVGLRSGRLEHRPPTVP